jgi:hypothetical protein
MQLAFNAAVMDGAMLDSSDADVLVVPVPGWQSAGKKECREKVGQLVQQARAAVGTAGKSSSWYSRQEQQLVQQARAAAMR